MNNVAATITGAGFFAKLIGIAIIGTVLLWPVETIRDLLAERMGKWGKFENGDTAQWGPWLKW